MELLAQSEDRPMRLQVYNAKTQATRELKLTPSRKWPGKGLIGVTIRFDSYEGVEDQLVHVLVLERSSLSFVLSTFGSLTEILYAFYCRMWSTRHRQNVRDPVRVLTICWGRPTASLRMQRICTMSLSTR